MLHLKYIIIAKQNNNNNNNLTNVQYYSEAWLKSQIIIKILL